MEREPIDLSPLALSELSRERIARTVLARAQRAVQRGPLAVLGGWMRPGLAAAAAIGAISLSSLAWHPAESAEAAARPLTIAEGLRLPQPAAEWISENRPPTEADLLELWEP
jgi:hypothetical protein